MIEKNLTETKTALEDFFLNYARAAMDMQDNEKILVNIKIKTKNYEKNPDIPSAIQMSASVKDLKKYYTGKMDEGKMKKALVYETTSAANQKKDIDVMANIFDTFLEKDNKMWISDDATDGIYLNGFGAVFNVPVPLSKSALPMHINFEVLEKKLADTKVKLNEQREKIEEKIKKIQVEHDNENSDGRKVIKKKYKYNVDSNTEKNKVFVYTTDEGEETKMTVHGDSIDLDLDMDVNVESDGDNTFIFSTKTGFDEAKVDSIMNKTKDDIIKTLSIYGSTLKSVKSDELINVNLKMESYKEDKSMSITCRKKDVEDYSNGKIDYNKFIDRIKIK
eukprot:Anaeramoba_ignava/c17637_g1_i1.p1 GENE.c17637_g1_i1~~c17637_g1_i1.p1  ORF type:complete len:334 (-),score=92.02 c17637_g1_i1:17-1018(-)